MACFLLAMSVAIITTTFRKKVPAKYHINWLNMLLWGGVLGLSLEHVAHQEIVPYFPFLSAMGSAADATAMLQEIATIGTAMLVACVSIWIVMLLVASRFDIGSKASAQ